MSLKIDNISEHKQEMIAGKALKTVEYMRLQKLKTMRAKSSTGMQIRSRSGDDK
ncbi:hypothetical protein [Bartonella doshiae]|uniref:hypothetical protein n=1 Tax=Bartonella doshiae TaxID=33044 RepID=UPI001ABA2448|nr:hypothetical protein [Bartonella doshiae]